MIDFAFQAGKALLNPIQLLHDDGGLIGHWHQMLDRWWEQSGKADVIPFMINHLNSSARRETELVA